MMTSPAISAAEREAAHAWLRGRGVPLIIFARERAATLIPRSIPLTAWLVLTGVLYAFAWPILIYLADDTTGNPGEAIGIDNDTFFLISLGVSLLLPLATLWVPWALRRLLPQLPVKALYPLGFLSWLLMFLIYSPLTAGLGIVIPIYFDDWLGVTVFSLLLLLAIFLELDSITIWAAKRTLHELWTLTPMIAKVLPTLMLAVLFAFVNGDIWRVADELSLRRTLEVMGVLLLLALFVAMTTSVERTKRLLGAHDDDYLEDFSPEEYREVADKTGDPWKGLLARSPQRLLTQRRHRLLNWFEWGNLVALPVLSQMIQALLFAAVVFVFFTWFGNLAIPTETITTWLSHSPANLEIAGLTVPVSAVLVKVAMILSAFASLNFVASTAADDRYATEFLTPMMNYLRETVMLRNIYLAAQGR